MGKMKTRRLKYQLLREATGKNGNLIFRSAACNVLYQRNGWLHRMQFDLRFTCDQCNNPWRGNKAHDKNNERDPAQNNSGRIEGFFYFRRRMINAYKPAN